MSLDFVCDRPGFGYRNRYFINAVESPDQRLVFLRTLKCASTFFYNNFERRLGWKELHYNQIVWDKQIVFAHCMPAQDRRAKGLAEYIFMHDLQAKYWQDLDLQHILHQSLGLDFHSLTAELFYSNLACDRIEWLPIMSDHAHTVEITNRWLLSQGIDPGQWDMQQQHLGTEAKRRISDHIRQQPLAEHVLLYLDRDQQIYESAVNRHVGRSR